ncbi:hypothetical protein X792_01125 [Dehalococcoides mccartyi CG1]|nr:hypothetical protein X792_01125 [Dehalococcoides mccartyi CG1]
MGIYGNLQVFSPRFGKVLTEDPNQGTNLFWVIFLPADRAGHKSSRYNIGHIDYIGRLSPIALVYLFFSVSISSMPFYV